jgi:hypothetical protein
MLSLIESAIQSVMSIDLVILDSVIRTFTVGTKKKAFIVGTIWYISTEIVGNHVLDLLEHHVDNVMLQP